MIKLDYSTSVNVNKSLNINKSCLHKSLKGKCLKGKSLNDMNHMEIIPGDIIPESLQSGAVKFIRRRLSTRLFRRIFITMSILPWIMTVPLMADDASGDRILEYQISRHDLNCIHFPFKDISVSTVSDAEVTVTGGNIYVLPADDEPITVFVNSSENEGESVLLRLIPGSIRARNIRVDAGEQGIIPSGGNESRSISNRTYQKNRREPQIPSGSLYGSREISSGAYGRASYYSRHFISAFKSIYHYMQHNSPESMPDFRGPADTVKLTTKVSRLCNGTSESIKDAFYMGEYLYAVLTVSHDRTGESIRCSEAVLAYAVLNDEGIYLNAPKIVLTALPGDILSE